MNALSPEPLYPPTPPEVAVVMPCLNEARTLAGCIDEARHALENLGVAHEIIVADNGSTDGSQAIARRHGARVVDVAQKGYGHALRAGLDAARAPFLIMGDADLSYDFTHAGRFVEPLRAGFDLVMGNRFRGGIQPGAMPWKNRWLGNPVLSWVGQLFFKTPARDFHCGLRGFTAEAYRRMDLRTTGMEFASEMVIKAALLGLKVTEVPTTLRPDGRGRPPHLRPWRDGWRHLRFMLLFSPRWLFLFPGLVLMLLGLATGAWLLPGPRTVGGITFDVHTLLLAATAVLLGTQAVSFAFIGKLMTIRAGLRPSDARFDRAMRWLSLEAGLLGGVTLVVLGLMLTIGAVWGWGQQGFGALDVGHTLRLVIPGGLFLTLGCQIMLTVFLLGVLRLDTRHAPSPS